MSNSKWVTVLTAMRTDVGALVSNLSTVDLAELVPACPEWTIHDLVAHLVGLAVDFSGGIADAMKPAFWDHDEVDRREIYPRRGLTIQQLLEEWDEITPQFVSVLNTADPNLAGALIGDFVCHDYDLRAAINHPGNHVNEAVDLSIDAYAGTLGFRIAADNLPALRIESDDRAWVLGNGDPVATVVADRFELFRALTGRRTRNEVQALTWTGDASRYVDIFSMYDWPETSLNEG